MKINNLLSQFFIVNFTSVYIRKTIIKHLALRITQKFDHFVISKSFIIGHSHRNFTVDIIDFFFNQLFFEQRICKSICEQSNQLTYAFSLNLIEVTSGETLSDSILIAMILLYEISHCTFFRVIQRPSEQHVFYEMSEAHEIFRISLTAYSNTCTHIRVDIVVVRVGYQHLYAIRHLKVVKLVAFIERLWNINILSFELVVVIKEKSGSQNQPKS